jgi:7-dehydrocholesterol reductase
MEMPRELSDRPAAQSTRFSRGLRNTLLPLLLIVAAPIFILFVWSVLTSRDGSLVGYLSAARIDWPRPTWTAAEIVLGFATLQALLLAVLPGRRVLGPVTPAGDRVSYRANGVLAGVVTHLVFLALLALGWVPLGLVYDEFGAILVVGSLCGLAGAALLYVKGRLAPSGPDFGASGNPLFDFYWGIELHPRIAGLDLKQLTVARFGMIGWSVLDVAFMAKQYELYGHVSSGILVASALQLAYIARFLWWESGYFATLDMMHDRFGFYLCWGGLAWLPALYPSAPLYLVSHPVELGPIAAFCILAVGAAALLITHLADTQRQRVRATDGKCLVWGRAPQIIRARYAVEGGGTQESLLLVSGYWGITRHFHYLSELSLALAWTVPCGFDSALAYIYPAYLAVLLVERAWRDDRRCRRKYGADWDEYCARVPWMMLPGVF